MRLQGRERSLLCFKFVNPEGTTFEPDAANRLWVAADGAEVWVFAGTSELSSEATRNAFLDAQARTGAKFTSVPWAFVHPLRPLAELSESTQ